MKPLRRRESAMQNDHAIEIGRVAPSIANRKPKLNLKSLNSLSIPIGVSPSNAKGPTEHNDYSLLAVDIASALVAVKQAAEAMLARRRGSILLTGSGRGKQATAEPPEVTPKPSPGAKQT
jgi:hypothetical protein